MDRTDAPLPPSFDLVVLGKKEKDMVESAGKNPHRREADVDANSRPINTLYDANAMPPPPLQVVGQQEPVVDAGNVEESEIDELRPLQESAQLAMDTHLRGAGGAPDAPMMDADMGEQQQTHASQSLDGDMSVANANEAPPIDPDMMEAGPASDLGPV